MLLEKRCLAAAISYYEGMEKDYMPPGGEAPPESFARKPGGVGGSDIAQGLGPVVWHHWAYVLLLPTAHPRMLYCLAATSLSDCSWL